MGKRPNKPPRKAEEMAMVVGMLKPKMATSSATTSATAPEVCARALNPSSMMKNVSNGRVDTSAERPTLPPIASVNTWN